MGLAEKRWSALVDYASQSEIAHGIDARVLPDQSGSLAPDLLVFQYVLRADMARVRVPQPDTPERADGLWKHTCFEAFISASGLSGYYELNFSPSGQWAIYSFDRYRTACRQLKSVRRRGSPCALMTIVSSWRRRCTCSTWDWRARGWT